MIRLAKHPRSDPEGAGAAWLRGGDRAPVRSSGWNDRESGGTCKVGSEDPYGSCVSPPLDLETFVLGPRGELLVEGGKNILMRRRCGGLRSCALSE